ncbi:enoyl-CoA hydratase/isomerase family protein [Alicyclobacillus mengziensis]|uniref:Enoyl-CoA hydratase/isomerase family protein n=1 Tax=Alicyclobacillus mengziensis TaxID=2931921 RepID=A0A9X7Z985_9BACL|nr:enoyl-CoA hydratase/isomerase family protein [Alicyclobacillus mengziensis]QSO49340.1 enoyl-CoA hydratase/isomerase family protein [Alicyclobacillus mengziensis]
MDEDVLISEDGPVLEFVLNNTGAGNTITTAMFNAMLETMNEQLQTPSARLLRIRANGSVFCLGRERSATGLIETHVEVERLVSFKRLLRKLPLITIAEVHGDAAGFGFGLAILCDYAIVSNSASLYFPEMQFGLPPSAIMTYLAEYIPPRLAFHLVLTGDTISPETAERIGLISACVAPDHVHLRAEAISERILKLDEQAVRDCKSFFQHSLQNNFEQNARLAVETLTIDSLRLQRRDSLTER